MFGLFFLLIISAECSSISNNNNNNVQNNSSEIIPDNKNGNFTPGNGDGGEGNGGGGTTDISSLSVTQICMIVGLPLHNCTCENYPMFCPKKYHFECSSYYDRIEGAVKITASLLGILGNGLILMVFFKFRKSHGEYRKLIALLAFYDFVFAVLILITSIPLTWTCTWLYGLAMCKILRPMLNLGSVVALGVIVIISVERYYGIVKPFAKKSWYLNVWTMNVGNLIVSLAIVFPMFFTLEINRDNRCDENWGNMKNGSLIYSWFLFIFVFLIPMIIISILYTVIIKSLHHRLQKTSGFLSNDQRQKMQRNKEFRKVLNILIAILTAYFILVFPNRIIWVVLEHIGDNISKTDYRVLKYLALFPYLFHVSINVFIYSAIDDRFKKELKSIFYKKVKKRSESTSSSLTYDNSRV